MTLYSDSKLHYCFVLNVSFGNGFIYRLLLNEFVVPHVPAAHLKANYKMKLKLVKQ